MKVLELLTKAAPHPMDIRMIEPRQIRAARALLNWSQDDLALASGIARSSIKNIENDITAARKDTIHDIQMALENFGIEFIPNSGIRCRQSNLEVFEGPDRFHDFTALVYKYIEDVGGEVCISVSDETLFNKYRKDPEQYRTQMKTLVDKGHVRVRILAEKSEFNSVFAEMRRQKSRSVAPTSFYAFGSNLALISFLHKKSPYIILINDSPFADAYRQSFDVMWSVAEVMTARGK